MRQVETPKSNLLTNYKKSSSNQDCFSRGHLPGIASCLALAGFTPVPLRLSNEGSKLIPAIPWRDFEVDGANLKDLERVRNLFSRKGVVGIALKAGQASNLLVLDVDDDAKFGSFYAFERLMGQASYLIETKDPKHYHVGFTYEPEFSESKNFLEEAGFEIKSNGALVNFFTVLPGFQYKPLKLEPLRPMPQELKERILALMTKQRGFSQKERKTFILERNLTPEIKESLEKIFKRLYELTGYEPKLRQGKYGPTWRGKCPCHNDNEPSLDIEVIGGRIRFKCWAGCPEEEIAKIMSYDLKVLKERAPESLGRISISVKIRELLQKNNFVFWLSQFEEPFVSITSYRHLKVESKEFRDLLQDFSYRYTGRPLHNNAMEEVLSFCRVWSRESGLRFWVSLRVGYCEEDNFIEVNLLREDGKILRISPESIELDYPKLKFITNKNQLPILFNYDLLRSLNLKDFEGKELLSLFGQIFNVQTKEDLALLLAWMIKTFYPKGEYPILAILGEKEGVGKTTTTKLITQLLDPNIAPLKTFPKNRDDLYVLAKGNFLLAFDNLSGISEDMSDALCQLSTGGSLSKRKLYTDAEVVDLPLKNPVILNSIFNVLQRRDLRRRCVVLELKRPIQVMTQKEIEQSFRELAPTLYSYLVLCVQEALKEKVINLPFLDLADFCEWVAKAHPVFFMSGHEFIRTLQENREEVAREILESNLLLPIIQEKLQKVRTWETTARDLLQELKTRYPGEKDLPSTPEKVGRELKKIASDLEAVGIKVEFVRSRKKRAVVFSYINPEEGRDGVTVCDSMGFQTVTPQSPELSRASGKRDSSDSNFTPFVLKEEGKERGEGRREEEVFKKKVGNLPSHPSHRHQASNDAASRGDGLCDGFFPNCHTRHLNNEEGRVPSLAQEPEGGFVYLFTPGVRRCSVCGWDVWKVEGRIYKEGKGEAQCLKCGRLGWFREFPRGKEVDEKDLPLLLYRLIPVEAKTIVRIDKDGKLEVEGGRVINPDLFKKLLPQN
jgi:hypothetical protein